MRTVGKGPSSSAVGPVNGTVVRSAEEKTAEYAVFALVPVFCVMGLLGILICNILKKKGYRCSSDKEGGDEETATPQKEGKRGKKNDREIIETKRGAELRLLSCSFGAVIASRRRISKLLQAHDVVELRFKP